MPKLTQPLTDREIKNAKPDKNKIITKLSDGGGLYLQIQFKQNKISKIWKLNYRFEKKQQTYTIGAYPIFSLSDVRLKREELKQLIVKGINPSKQKREEKQQIKEKKEKIVNTFQKIAVEWHRSYEGEVSEGHHHKLFRSLELHIFPHIKNISIIDIKPRNIITILEHIKNDGKEETVRRAYTLINKIFRYGVTYEYLESDVTPKVKKW